LPTAANSFSASASSLAFSVSPKPWKEGLPAQWPSEARTWVSPTLKAACITLSSELGGMWLGSGLSGFSLKRISISTLAPIAPL
jgi:hypothetical protein